MSGWLPISGFAVSSVAMILLNKGVMMEFQEPVVVVLLQNVSTLVILQAFTESSVFALNLDDARRWSLCALLFCVNLVTSLMSLAFIRAPTFMVIRNVQPILSCAVEWTMQRPTESLGDLQFLFCILVGAVVYASNDLTFHAAGYAWAAVHVGSATAYAIIVRRRQDEMAITVPYMSMYNNVLSIPLLSMILLLDMPKISVDRIADSTWGLLLATCVCAAAISTSGFAAQKLVSPTSWLAINNMTKIPAIILSYAIFGGIPSFAMLFGMAVSLASGYCYALSRINEAPPVHAWGYTLFTCVVCVYVSACSDAWCGNLFASAHYYYSFIT